MVMHEVVVSFVEYATLAIEAAGALTISVGFLCALYELFKGVFRHGDDLPFVKVRLIFARYLSLALEFQLAADILSTIIAPGWEEIGKLAAIALIRTFLNYFLQKEIREEKRLIEEEMEMTDDDHDQKATRHENI